MIKECCFYYFWDKKLCSIAEIFISHADLMYIYFTYRGKKYRCPQKYAITKLYDDPKLVPVLSDVDNTDYSSFTSLSDIVKEATMVYTVSDGSYYDYEEVNSFYRNAYDNALRIREDEI